MSLDVGSQRPGDLLPRHLRYTAAACVRCQHRAVAVGSDWCQLCHPRNPDPPPLASDAEVVWRRMAGGAGCPTRS